MSVSLSDLLAPTPQPTKAGAGAFAPAKAGEDSFAAVLAAAPRAMAEASAATGTAGAKGDLQAAVAAVLQSAGIMNIPAKPGQALSTGQLGTVELPPLDLDPAVLQRLQQGAGTPADFEAFKRAFEKAIASVQLTATPDAGDAAATEAAQDGASTAVPVEAPVAGIVVPVPSAEGDAVPSEDNVEMALKIAGERPSYVPPTGKPAVTPQPGQPAGTPVLQEGRASAAGAPAVHVDVDTQRPKSGDAPHVSRAVLEALAPRASGPAAIAASAATAAAAQPPAAPPPGTPPLAAPEPAAPQAAAQTMPPAASAPSTAPVPAAAQQLAATPHVVSVQASATPAADAPETPAAATTSPAGPATLTASATSVGQSTVPAPPAAALLNPEAAPDAPPPVPPAAETEAKAADPALAVLTKDKAEAKSGATAPAPNAAKAEQPATAAKPEAAPATADARPQEVKPDAPAEKASAADKPAAPEPRAQQPSQAQGNQPPLPLGERPAMTDTAVRTVQQMQSLPAVAIPQIAGEIAARFKQGTTRFEIRLDPPELGRVDVRIEVDSDGRVHSRLMVEKSETLDLLKADQRALERALHDAGFKSDQNSLSFSLKDDRGNNGFAKFDEQRFLREELARTAPEEEPARLMAGIAYRAPMRGPGGIDLRV